MELKTLASILLVLPISAQVIVNGNRDFRGSVDAGSATRTAPMKTGTILPATCTVGDLFFKTDASAGQNIYACSSTNTWTVASSAPQSALIQEIILNSPATTFTFNSIPGTYRDLNVRCEGRGDAASTAITPIILFNGDNGNDYDNSGEYTSNAGWNASTGIATAGALNGVTGLFPGSTSPANYSSGFDLVIQNYVGTTFYKRGRWLGSVPGAQTAAGLYNMSGTFWWRNTAAITSISVAIQTGNFIAGSRCSLYGSL